MYRLNDTIVSVNGVSTENVTHAQAVDALKKAGKNVLLVSFKNVHVEFVLQLVNARICQTSGRV